MRMFMLMLSQTIMMTTMETTKRLTMVAATHFELNCCVLLCFEQSVWTGRAH
jgi:hypothetical protein